MKRGASLEEPSGVSVAKKTRTKTTEEVGSSASDHTRHTAAGTSSPHSGHLSDPTHDATLPSQDPAEPAVKPFPLMSLPSELRIEIYRACLTRPFAILLSRHTDPVEPPVPGVRPDGSMDEATFRSLRLTRLPAHSAAAPGQRRSTSRSAYTGRYVRETTSIPDHVTRLRVHVPAYQQEPPRKPKPQDADPLRVALLRASKQVYREARPILYSENSFIIDIDTAIPTLAALHQRSRGQIKYLHLNLPSYTEILERFTEVVRLSLRYCWGLRVLVIAMPFATKGDTSAHFTMYANAFDILRWLPKQCQVVLEGAVSEKFKLAVERNANLARNMNEVTYARRQLMSMNGASSASEPENLP